MTIVPASEMRFPEWDVLCEPPVGDEREAFFWRALIRTYAEDGKRIPAWELPDAETRYSR